MSPLAWFLLAFLSGSVLYSPLLARWALGRDIRQYGDGNPGATNVFKAGGRGLGLAAVLLDGFKGAIPVGLAYWSGAVAGGWLVAVALAPALGHAFSPWLVGRGGKAVAVTFGLWTGLTGPEAPIVLGCLLGIWFMAVAESGWALAFTWLCFGAHLWHYRPAPEFLLLWLLNGALLAWKYRADFRGWPHLRPVRLLHLSVK